MCIRDSVYGSLHFSGFHGSIETTVFFYSEEEVPSPVRLSLILSTFNSLLSSINEI